MRVTYMVYIDEYIWFSFNAKPAMLDGVVFGVRKRRRWGGDAMDFRARGRDRNATTAQICACVFLLFYYYVVLFAQINCV